MHNSGLLDAICDDPIIAEVVADARTGLRTLDLSCPAASRPWMVAALARTRPLLLVTSTYREAEHATGLLESLLGTDEVAYYPAWETLPHERLSPRTDTVGRRLAVLRRLAGADPLPAPRVIVAPVRSVLQPQVKGLAEIRPVALAVGEDYAPDQLASDLVDAAYARVDLVERRGEFAVRGGIVDVFPPTLDHPVRIDFFGDTVEDITTFQVADQRSTDERHERVVATPCRELLLTDDVRERAAALLESHPELSDLLTRIAEGHVVDGMEALTPALVDGMELLVDCLADDTLVLVADPELVRTRAIDLVTTSEEFLGASWAAAAAGGEAPIDLASAAYQTLGHVRLHSLDRGLGWWSMSPFSLGESDPEIDAEPGELADVGVTGVESRRISATKAPTFEGDTDGATAQLRRLVGDGWTVALAADGAGLLTRMSEVLAEADIPARIHSTELGETGPGLVHLFAAPVREGVLFDQARVAVVALADLAGHHTQQRSDQRMPTRRRHQINPLELAAGDPVVHEHHGVGRFREMTQRTVGGSTRDYLVIEYAPSKRGQPGDMLHVPMDQLDLVTRYVGGESPSLDKLGGSDWAKRKNRARKAVREIAAELIKLYAARQASQGHAFGPDTPWQRELEDAFVHIETPDQLECINEVKRDMERVTPMDRLICGDVGYGKTEIAVRAAFKAVQDGKQVAVLVPTTLLVQQHYETFAERYAGFPVTVKGLSRFQTAEEAEEVRTGVVNGKVDVVVGTHRLLAGEVSFKDLGLVIIDEEQRFGVEHKEALKQLRVNVDVLSMSATPIPRTLEMAVTGIREMSVIATPPEERHPVLTFAGPYDRGQVAAAIRRELAREGQVFYIHNRVQSIEKTAKVLAEMVPEARIVTAHGQMGEKRLEQVMVDFWERRADVLVCTTIVEAGLDISSANTLLIERADLLGLSQLHQLRGRVGRGRERAYAYFLYPPEKALTETAHDRLSTMTANAELGAGMAIAMKDLEIRGAGNLLGGQQSGHIADVGFDLYLRLVGEAVSEFRDGRKEAEPDMRIELPVRAHLPEDYIDSERLRLEMYKRLAEVRSHTELDAVVEEMSDRYGELPAAAQELVSVATLRLLARSRGITEIVVQGGFVRFVPGDLPESRQMRAARLYPKSGVRDGRLLIPRPDEWKRDTSGVLAWATGVVEALYPERPAAATPDGGTA